MYSPNFYKETDLEKILRLIDEYPFATLLSTKENPTISHLPMILSRSENGEPELVCHMARANPHWRELQEHGQGKALFHGPHAYISPAWYQPAPDNVPTWNYSVVHVVGEFEIVEDKTVAFELMRTLVNTFEDRYGTKWNLPQGAPEIDRLMKAITVFKLKNLSFGAKSKLSQRLGKVDRDNVIEQLGQLGIEDLARYMRS